jgi:hypothetical protein
MIFHILVTIFLFGFALLTGILSVMRDIYSFSTHQPPLIPSDSAAKVSLDEDHERGQSRSTGGLSPTRDFDQARAEKSAQCRLTPTSARTSGYRWEELSLQ